MHSHPLIRTLIAGIVGGIVILAWNSVAHVVLHVGDMGIDVLPNEEVIVATLRESVLEPGFYFFPGVTGDASPQEQAAWEQSYRAGPTGVLVYQADGSEPIPVTAFMGELVSNIIAAFLAAWILMLVRGTYPRRVAVVTSLGLFAWLTISASYWLWWNFPLAFVAAEGIETVVGWLLAGCAMAGIVRPEHPTRRDSRTI